MEKLLTLLVPAYNELENLKIFLPTLLEFCEKHNFILIIVNDGSTDETKSFLKNFESNNYFKYYNSPFNLGYGGAIKKGLDLVETEYVVTLDADAQHNLEDILSMYQTIINENADLVIGKRENIIKDYYRRLGKKIILIVAKLLVPNNIKDLNSGLKIYKTKIVKVLSNFCPDNMAFSDIITLLFLQDKKIVLEKGITINKRKFGKSTISTKTAFLTILEIIHIATYFNPLRVFLPISAVLFFLGTIWAIPILLAGKGLSIGSLFLLITSLMIFMMGLISEQISQIRKTISKK